MRTYVYLTGTALLLALATATMADNEVSGPDAGWDNDGDETAVTTITADSVKARPLFDLMGRRVREPKSGQLYIFAGHKVIWK